MGTLTLAELRTEIKAHLGTRTDITDAEYTRALNLTQLRMARRHDFRELSIRSTGTLTFTDTPATDQLVAFTVFTTKVLDEVISFILHDGDAREKKLRSWLPRQLDKFIPNAALETTGFPDHYVRWAEQFELFRIPDQAYQFIFRAYVKPDVLSVEGTASNLDNKDDLLIFLTTSYMYGRIGEFERSNHFFAIYKDEFNAALVDDVDQSDMDIKPPQQITDLTFGEYWRDPFVRGRRRR